MIFKKHDKFVNKKWKGVNSKKNQAKTCFADKDFPPGLVLAGPDMSKSRFFVNFFTFRVQNKVFDEISR